MTSIDELSRSLGLAIEKTPPRNISNVKYHYVAAYVVEIRAQDDIEVLDTNFLGVTGPMFNDDWYSQCITEEDIDNILSLVEEDEYPIGMFRYVVAGTCDGESYQTQDGTEYDAWQTYELLSRTQLTDDEVTCVLNGFKQEHEQYLLKMIEEDKKNDN